jgi:hypothetical protein
MGNVPADVQQLLRQIAPSLVDDARRVIAEHPEAQPVGLIFDAAAAVDAGMVAESGTTPLPAGVVVPHHHAKELLGDDPQLDEWLVPGKTPVERLPVVVVAGASYHITSIALTTRATKEPDQWQRFMEEQQSRSLIDKHADALAERARTWYSEHPSQPVVGMVFAPELSVRSKEHDDIPAGALDVQESGETVCLSSRKSVERTLAQNAPDLLEWLRHEVPTGTDLLPIIAATEHGFLGALRLLDG